MHIEIFTSDRLSSEFFQPDETRVKDTIRSLNSPRLFQQPQLVIACPNRVSTISAKAIDIILARTHAPLPKIFPLNSPAGLIRVNEVDESWVDRAAAKDLEVSQGPDGLVWRTFRVEYRTLGGWKGALEVHAQDRGTAIDRRQTFGHYFELPVIPFQLQAGGLGLLNPANLTWVSTYPVPDALPESSLHLELVRSAPASSRLEPHVIHPEAFNS